jgi:hypothetical protein
MSDSEKEELGAELACRTGRAEQAHKDRKWQSFNLAEQTEYRWLTAYQSYWIEQYPIWSEGMYWYVKVDGENTLCRPSDYSD